MRVTKTKEQAKTEKDNYERAIEGCSVCPECGETLSVMEARSIGLRNRGVLSFLYQTALFGNTGRISVLNRKTLMIVLIMSSLLLLLLVTLIMLM